MFLSSVSFSQKKSKKDFAHLYLLRTSTGEGTNVKATVFVSDQKGLDLPAGGAIEYNMITEGEITVFVQYENDDKNYFCKTKLKKGKDNYVCLRNNHLEEVSYEYVGMFLHKRKNEIIKHEEDHANPEKHTEFEPDYSTVYIISAGTAGFYSGQAGAIYVANQSPFNIELGSVISYRIFSEGEVSIQAHSKGVAEYFYATLKVKRGNEYFLYLTNTELTEQSKERVKDELIRSMENRKRIEENIDEPIHPKTIKKPRAIEVQGTCFLISTEGYMVTNFHCIQNATEITVKGIDGDFTTKYGASIIATDPTNDLALIKVNNKNIKFAAPVYQLRSSGVMQGEKVYAMGYPIAYSMGEEVKITEGIISSLSGIKKDISNFQITAAVNPGNSGGPLIDENGNLIGVIYAKSIIAESAGYAIKSSYLEAFLKNIESFTYPTLTNTIKDKSLPEKVMELKNFIFIVETGK